MTDKKTVTCILCPVGCKIQVDVVKGRCRAITGHLCRHGVGYAHAEAIDPKRMVTTSVLVENGEWPLVSVKTSAPLSRDKIFTVLEEIKKISVEAPIALGQILMADVGGTAVDIIATRPVPKKRVG
jgi:CxxC motif-containing protein